MQSDDTVIERFFRTFEANSNTTDTAAAVLQFADVFIAAGPSGAQAVKASDFALALPKRRQFFDSLGCRSTRLVSLRVNPVDSRYVLAETRWQMTFAHEGGEDKQALADSVFLLDIGQILLYLAKQDLMEMLRQHGVLST